ncbi:hypothetical protein C1645_824013 [Glomus cerebriforme]|uniref:RuvC endonuclease subdomain 3 domain-containing protein n=1 Tax=Glomus cerebriforme TaxID=658196 RepID=A0A397SY52_9GLOM|nr:hypothetical protein C1645_824013 [Glomus cerebriforme]
MVATYLKRYIRNELDKKTEYQKTKVQSIKGSLTSYFRKQLLQYKERERWQFSPFYYKEQLRSLTPYHHAIDAIVLAHFKSRGYIQLLEDLTKINQSKLKLKKQKITEKQFVSLGQEITGYRKRGEEILPDFCEKLRKNEKLELSKNISLSKLVEKIGLEELNLEYGEKYNFLVVRDKKKKNNYTIWDTSKYAGFGWLLRPYEAFTFSYSEELENELMNLVGLPLIYTGTTNNNVSSIEIVGLVKKKESKETLQTIYPEHGDRIIKVKNIVNSLGTKEKSIKKISPSIKLLKIDILGKRKK